MGEIIPFPVGIIPFPVLKMHFILLGIKRETSCKRCFLIRDPEVGEKIPFPVGINPFPGLKISLYSLMKMRNTL